MNIGEAIELAKSGKKAQRAGWASYGAYIFISEDGLVSWASNDHAAQIYHADNGDLLGEDWQEKGANIALVAAPVETPAIAETVSE